MNFIFPRQNLLTRLLRVREETEKLCEPLCTEDYVPQIVDYASPPKWHLAHTSWFFEEFILAHHLPGYERFDPQYTKLFNSYYNGIATPAVRAQRGIISRPGVQEIYRYRSHVNDGLERLLGSEVEPTIGELLELGIQHEQQHQELLLTDLKLAFSFNPLNPVYDEASDFESSSKQSNAWHTLAAGDYEVGADEQGFSFDNERPKHRVAVPAFQIASGLVTNQDWIAFIEDGGYQRVELWLDEGWQWKTKLELAAPMYWHFINGSRYAFTLAGLKPLALDDAVVHISYYEADAYARWCGARLPTEFEWEVASSLLSWGERWEWTSSAYQGYPGFTPFSGVAGEYNGKFMVNQYVLRGASQATPAGHSRCTYRNFFHPNHQWQFTGLRLAK